MAPSPKTDTPDPIGEGLHKENNLEHRKEPEKHPETTPVETSYNSVAVQIPFSSKTTPKQTLTEGGGGGHTSEPE